MKKKKIFLVCGARPNFVKISPLRSSLKQSKSLRPLVVYTGQHYDYEMAETFFNDLKIPIPDFYLNASRLSGFYRMSKIMVSFSELCKKENPHMVIVVGDVDSTISCALVASRLGIPLAHVEAGLRSFDRTMPEEISRIVTDHLSDILFTSCKDANLNLMHEGVGKKKIFFVGNIMIDTLVSCRDTFISRHILKNLHLSKNHYVLLTLHRPENVECKKRFKNIISAIQEVSKHITIIFPAHPRTKAKIDKFKPAGFFNTVVRKRPKIRKGVINVLQPQGYMDFMNLMRNSKFVLTDSGGIQEEATVLHIPCITLRDNTERPITVKKGSNVLAGSNSSKIIRECSKILKGSIKKGKIPMYWDGKTAQRIRKILESRI